MSTIKCISKPLCAFLFFLVENTVYLLLEPLPEPTHVFIGGSSGELDAILRAILQKNPHARIVINAVTLETEAETLACIQKYGFSSYSATQLQVSRARSVGKYHMVSAQNPVWIFTMQNV